MLINNKNYAVFAKQIQRSTYWTCAIVGSLQYERIANSKQADLYIIRFLSLPLACTNFMLCYIITIMKCTGSQYDVQQNYSNKNFANCKARYLMPLHIYVADVTVHNSIKCVSLRDARCFLASWLIKFLSINEMQVRDRSIKRCCKATGVSSLRPVHPFSFAEDCSHTWQSDWGLEGGCPSLQLQPDKDLYFISCFTTL